MMLAPQLFLDIVRPCPGCDTPYDIRLHAPHVLPCSHTFCLMCLSKHEQRKKRNCLICRTKYSKFAPNLALIEVSQRIDERHSFLDKETRQCDECDNRVTRSMLRQCETCEKQFVTRTEYKLECIVCLECCVNSHNGHELHRLSPTAPSIENSPMIQQRVRHPSTSSAVSVHFRAPSSVTGRLATKGIINTIKSWSFRSTNNELSFVLTPQSKLAFSEEDIVMQCKSPFYDNKPIPVDSQRRHQYSSSRYICYDTNNPNNTSADSVFADTSQSYGGPRQSSYIRSTYNDSGIATPGSSRGFLSNRFSHSAASLRLPSSKISSNIQAIQTSFGTTVAPKNSRVRMGLSEIFNTPRLPMPSPIHTSTPNPQRKSTRSETSVFPPTPTSRHHLYI
ncbi:unnamed protein product [Caenorhabditis sp. 36 PRJEB53466]|nr:unnamed protein product [Caenorhabditis sp. 36 PRJEB53466]